MSELSTAPVIMWFRQDLRIRDNPALVAALGHAKVIPIYILDDVNAAQDRIGAASRWWLHHALSSLGQSLDGQLQFYCGDASEIIPSLVTHYGATGVYWNRCYEPWRLARDSQLKIQLRARGISAHSSNASLLWEPWQVLKKDATPYRVFTPYYRRGCLSAPAPRQPLPAPTLHLADCEPSARSLRIGDLELLPRVRWDAPLRGCWEISEKGAHRRLDDFVDSQLEDYRDGRNFPNRANVSRLSPYLHFGQISVNSAWYRAQAGANYTGDGAGLDTFLSELGWREFSHYLLYHFPQLPRENLQSRFDNFPWIDDAEALSAWQEGRTGYPLVDAGMRELWLTGYMHNRVRMVVGSFLVKNLLLHWHHGEAWFWDCLVDADLASNSASWQWVAGSGADAAPFFRIFNPITQSEKFDGDGDYIRRYVPELSALPKKYIHAPWLAPEAILSAAKVVIGVDYPAPIVDIKASRARALEAFAHTKNVD